MVVVWSANHFYYNGELFSCLLYSSLEAIVLPPAEPGVAFGPTNARAAAVYCGPDIFIRQSWCCHVTASDKNLQNKTVDF